ncbi:tetratricopeptide repeat protein [Pseudoalteromonas rubra]|uniref:tetratricopeptide repeat protein n=1 Tax=Pseudoalteromonas rubra TaxID=43658 RepID=UPI002DBEEA97|nr:tetratricopeptide repeat protein [Pseudoalteromonas rubra]MEC4090228.1 tetratricopeptide repeat protein [Pseudoalteromonas rubra]
MPARLWLLSLFTVLLSACASPQKRPTPPPPRPDMPFNHALFNPVAVLDEQSIFTLPEQEQQAFLTYYQKHILAGMRGDRIIFEYLHDQLEEFHYRGETYSATESLQYGGGNCISLAVLTQAYAFVAGIDTRYHKVASAPVYQQLADTILISSHFKTKLLAPEQQEQEDWITLIRPGTVIDYFPAQDAIFVASARYKDLVAKFYANLAVKAMLADEFDLSAARILRARSYAPDDPELINIAAVLHRRAGDLTGAETIYQYADQHRLISHNLLSNYLVLAKEQQATALAARLEQQLEDDAKTPFDFLMNARSAIAKGQLKKASRLLVNVVKETPYLPEPYFELAKISYLQGDHDTARQLLEQAIEKTSDPEKSRVFTAKHSMLQSLTEQ